MMPRVSPSLAPTRRLTVLYLAALGFTALLLVLSQVVLHRAIAREEGDARLVNIAGRQRMLSQKIS
ncbi:MAG TPA: type IV pili methyl-accepting chemotaxis transducer N-terminal domain-containing protein, partial [Abditibacterium sp.]